MNWLIATLTSDRDLLLSGLSLAISVALCPLALVMFFRAMASRGRPRLAWLLAAAAAFGTGIWGLALLSHVLFTSHVLFPSATKLADAPSLLGLSLVEAVTGALGAFSLWSRSRGQPSFVMLGGAMVALSVVAMHYTGLAAHPSPLPPAGAGHGLDLPGVLPIVIVLVGVALLILFLGAIVTLVDVRFVLRRAEEAQRLRQLADSAFEGLLIHRDGAAGGQARRASDDDQRVEAPGGGRAGVGVCRQVGSERGHPGRRAGEAARQDRATGGGTGFFGESVRSMSADRRRAMIERDHPQMSVARQCELVSIGRSTFYRVGCWRRRRRRTWR